MATRADVPVDDLEFPWPECSECNPESAGDMDYDGDRWWCNACGSTWTKNGMRGHRPRRLTEILEEVL